MGGMGSTGLKDYGIQTEQSDIRAHVSVVNRAIYSYQTERGLEAIQKHRPKTATAGQPGVQGITARGWLVRPDQIQDLRRLRFHSWPHWNAFTPTLDTSAKGALAVDCVVACMRLGRFPFWIGNAEEAQEREVQISGTDIIVQGRHRIQVKCDWRCGEPPGTGHLFLQFAERNPLSQH